MPAEMYPPSTFESQLKNLNPDHWADEGAGLAQKFVYANIQQNGTESPQYRDRRINLALKQAALGGYRLARILDNLLK